MIGADVSRSLVPAPSDGGDGVCTICRSWSDDAQPLCPTCRLAAASLGSYGPLAVVQPIALYSRASPLRDWLKFYKPGSEAFRPGYSRVLAGIVRRFAVHNLDSFRAHVGEWTAVCVVPSSWRHDADHPLEGVLRDAGVDWRAPMARLLVKGPQPVTHREYRPEGFTAEASAAGERVLLVDDVYASGAQAQSAAAALRAVRAHVRGILVIGRRINPEFNEPARVLWERQRVQAPCG